MITFTDLTGLAGVAFGCAVVVASWVKQKQLITMAGIFIVMLIPLGGLPPAGYVRGMIGDLSVTSVVLLAMVAARRCGWSRTAEASRSECLLVVLAACLLYPMALGAGSVDPYRWGYGDPWFLAVLLIIAVAGQGMGLAFVVPAIPLAVLAWSVGWYESTNLWDYLVDPLLAFYAMARLVALTRTRR